MVAIADVLLLLLPLGLYLLWRRLNPAREASLAFVLALLAGLALMAGAAVWFGTTSNMTPGTAYVPSSLGTDGHVEPARVDPRQ